MEYLHDYTDSSGNIYVVVRDNTNFMLAFLTVDEYSRQLHPVLSQRKVPQRKKGRTGRMEYLYDYMDSSGNIYVVVQDDNNILTLTADEYNERVHQENNRRTSS